MADPLRAEQGQLSSLPERLLNAAVNAATPLVASIESKQRIAVRDNIAFNWAWTVQSLAKDVATRAEIAHAMQRIEPQGGLGLSQSAAYDRIEKMAKYGAWPTIFDQRTGQALYRIALPDGAAVQFRSSGTEPPRTMYDGMDVTRMDDGTDSARLDAMHGTNSGAPESMAKAGRAVQAIVDQVGGYCSIERQQEGIERFGGWILAELAAMGDDNCDPAVAIGWAADIALGAPTKQKTFAVTLQEVRDKHAAGKLRKPAGALLYYLLNKRGIHHTRSPP